jgi:hypothetical protein
LDNLQSHLKKLYELELLLAQKAKENEDLKNHQEQIQEKQRLSEIKL